VAPIYRGCENGQPRNACRTDQCYWDGQQCLEPLLRVQLGAHVLGIDTGSPFTVLATETCRLPDNPQQHVATHCAAVQTAEECERNASCRWMSDQCAADVTQLRYVSGPVAAVPWGKWTSLHEELVPFCSAQIFPQNEDGLVGLQVVPAEHADADQVLLRHILEDEPQDRMVVVDKSRNTVCVGKYCRTTAEHGIEERPKLTPHAPVVQHDGKHRLLLDTGTTATTAWPELCQIGNLDLAYLEIHDDKVRYKLAPGALERCARQKEKLDA
jgi:hypothetical protein